MRAMSVWRRSYVLTQSGDDNEIDSSDDSDSDVGTETLKSFHRRKSTLNAVKARVSYLLVSLYLKGKAMFLFVSLL